MTKRKTPGIKNPLRKILLILVLLVLLPAISYLSLELISLNEYEQMISGIYEQQLDVILFSVNQYVWDYINSWRMSIETSFTENKLPSRESLLDKILQENSSIKYIMIMDTTLTDHHYFTLDMPKQEKSGEFLQDISVTKDLIPRLQRYKQVGYNKIESVLLRGNQETGDEKIILVSLTRDHLIMTIMVDFRQLIEQVIIPKLEDIAGERMAIGVFTVDTNEPVYQNESFQFQDSQLYKKLWLFPDYLVGIRTKGKSLEDLATDRLQNTLILILALMFVLIAGAWIVFRNIRSEIKLAQMKSDFVSNVSHELRTPLALIRMYAETLEMDRIREESKRKEYYQIINKESERLTRLINNILNFSRIESGRKEYDFHKVVINDVVQNTAEIYGYHIHSMGFEFNLDLAPDLLPVNLDEESVTECIINLLDNAVKYSDDTKYINLSTGFKNEMVYISVQDKGIGIEQKNIDRIFEKFYRVSDSMVHNTKGSGLGLTLIKHIIASHGGKISVESKPGEGTTFYMYFPIAE